MKTWNIALPFVLLASLTNACSGKVSEGDSETHWVACKTTEDCSGTDVCQAERCVEPSASGGGGSPTGSSGGSPTGSSGGSPASGAGGGGGAAQDPAWACLGQPSTTQDGTDAAVDFVLRDVVASSPIADGRALLCNRLDVDCSVPVDDADTDSSGRVTLNVPGSFNGYVQFTTPTTWPTFYGFARSSFSGTGERSVQVATPATVAALTTVINAPQLDGNGFALVSVRDCTGKAASGVRFGTEGEDPSATPFYALDGLPAKDAPETDASGYGGLANVTPGAVTVYAVLNGGTGRRVGAISFFVKPNSLTAVSIEPNDQ